MSVPSAPCPAGRRGGVGGVNSQSGEGRGVSCSPTLEETVDVSWPGSLPKIRNTVLEHVICSVRKALCSQSPCIRKQDHGHQEGEQMGARGRAGGGQTSVSLVWRWDAAGCMVNSVPAPSPRVQAGGAPALHPPSLTVSEPAFLSPSSRPGSVHRRVFVCQPSFHPRAPSACCCQPPAPPTLSLSSGQRVPPRLPHRT